jgi:hypothetical protein
VKLAGQRAQLAEEAAVQREGRRNAARQLRGRENPGWQPATGALAELA